VADDGYLQTRRFPEIVNELRSITNNGVRVVYIPDVRLTDESRIESLASDLGSIVGRSDINRLLLNFGNVKFMGSAMIGKLIMLNNLCKREKADLRLCRLNEELHAVFKQMKIDKILRIHATEEEALAAFAGKKKGWFR
jgi:anti-sigma B factor antagonist